MRWPRRNDPQSIRARQSALGLDGCPVATTERLAREGKVELREAIIDLGNALRQGHPDFARYAAELRGRGKPKGIVLCALGQRANRVAFAMMRDQRPFDPTRW